MKHLTAEQYDLNTRRRLLWRLREYLDNGFKDPELLYFGGRYAVSLGMAQEACRFLDPLAEMLWEDGKPSPGYMAVGLLYLKILALDDKRRDVVLENLRQLALSSSEMAEALQRSGFDSTAPLLPGSPHHLVHDLKQNGASSAVHPLQLVQPHSLNTVESVQGQPQKPSLAALLEAVSRTQEPIYRIQLLAQVASLAYLSEDLVRARWALENILLLDGDQPDALRNLVTIASEQQDIETYERYWRRYIKVLLWRIMRGDDQVMAWADLTQFYSRVATVMDRELGKTLHEVQEILRRPGFLPRWLEAHTGLVWLDAAAKSRRDWQTGLEADKLVEGRLGHLALMKYWYQLFYPEFYPYLELGQNVAGELPMPGIEAKTQLSFDPALKLLKRFLEWSKFQFAVQSPEDRHAEIVLALAGCIARIPTQRYILELAQDHTLENLEQKPLRRVLQEACSLPIGFKVSKFIDTQDWSGLIAFLHDPDTFDKLTPIMRLFLAFALCNVKREAEGLELAAYTLPDMTPAELKDDTQTYHLWRNILHANINKAIHSEDNSIPLVSQRLALITQKIEAILDLEQEHIFYFKQECLEEVKRAHQQVLLKKLIDETIEKVQNLVKVTKFEEARQVIRTLPDQPDEVADLKRDLLRQIGEVEEQSKLQKRIEEAIEKTKSLVSQGKFNEARRVIQALPDNPQDMFELKRNFLKQINDVEAQANAQAQLNQQIETAIEQAKTKISWRDFNGARQVIRALPDFPPDLKTLKTNLLNQINEAERYARR